MTSRQFLARIPLFSNLAEEQYDIIDSIVVPGTVARGQSIFAEGDPARGFYIVKTGRVKIFKLSPEGKEQILHVFGPGEPFAEVAVFTGGTYPAHAVALEKSELLFFPRQAFADMIEDNTSMAMNMLASLSLRLKQFADMIESLSLQEVPARLAAHLLYLAGKQQKDDFDLDLPKGQLASLLGTSPETLSRIFNKLTANGLIRMQRSHITILDREHLEEVAEGMNRL